MKKFMGAGSSKRSKVRIPVNNAQELDLEAMPQFAMQQSQSLSTYQALPPLVLSMNQLARRENVAKEAIKEKVLDENPELSELMEQIHDHMAKLNSNVDADVKAKTLSRSTLKIFEKILDLFALNIPTDQKKLLGDEIATNKGGDMFTKILTAMNDHDDSIKSATGLTLPVYEPSYIRQCKSLITSVCVKASEESQDFRTELGRTGIFQVLVNDLTKCIDKLGDKQTYDEIVKPSLSLLLNCAKANENKAIMKEAKVLEAMALYLKIKKVEVNMMATLILSHIVEEEDDGVVVTVDNIMIKSMISHLRSAIANPTHKHEGFKAEDIASALMNLAGHDKHKETIVNEGAIPLLVELLKKGNASEKTVTAKIVWVLSFSNANKKKMVDNKDLVKSLKVLSKMDGTWRASATGAIWVLEEERRMNQRNQQQLFSQPTSSLGRVKKTTRTSVSTSSRMSKISPTEEEKESEVNKNDSLSGRHIMISYQWSCQKLMIRVKEQLERTGYRVWIDIESMGGSTLQAMAEAVENSAVVLLCMSRKYKNSPNCRTEAEYAYKLGKPLIPIRVEQNYEPDGWLGALQGAKLYYDFSNMSDFETIFSKLTKEIGLQGQTKRNDSSDQPSLTVSTAVAASPPPQSQKQVTNWTNKDVKDWAAKNKITVKSVLAMDGETLLFLKGLKSEAPEFYYRFAYDRLGMTELKGLLDLNKDNPLPDDVTFVV